MTSGTAASIGVFIGMQVVAQLLFKWGSLPDGRWWWGFFGGNLFGFTSIWLLMMVYKAMNPNIAMGICVGGSFLLTQLALALVFRSDISATQWAGIATIFGGMLMLAMGKA